MNFINRNRERKAGQEPKLMPMPAPSQHPAVNKHIEYVTGIERQLQEALEKIEAQTVEIETLQREVSVERRERRNAQIARDEFHTRAIASETAVNNAAAILLDEVKRGREFSRERPVEQPPGPVVVDLDQMAASINEAKENG